MTAHTIHCATCGKGLEDGALFCPHCGEAITYKVPDEDPFVGRMVSQRYTVVKRIASGGMGEVYLARHAELNQHVAVKFLHRRFADDEEFATRFFNEARSACRVNHPYAVAIYDFGRMEDGTLYIVMEFIEGISLKEMIKRDGRLDPKRALRIGRQACEVLSTAHEQSVVHRDVKPDNLMVIEAPNGRVSIKMLDFGIAKILDEESSAAALTQTGVTFGTPEYMSPEQASGREVDKRSDIYSLGLVIYSMLVGHPPFRGKNKLALLQRHIRETPPRLDHACPAPLPTSLVKLVESTLEKDPDNRPQSMEALLARLEVVDRDVETGSISVPSSPSHIPPKREPAAAGRSMARSILTHRDESVEDAIADHSLGIGDGPPSEAFELGDGPSLLGDAEFTLGTGTSEGLEGFSLGDEPDFDDDPYAAPLASGVHPATGGSNKLSIGVVVAVLLIGAVVLANRVMNPGAEPDPEIAAGSGEVVAEQEGSSQSEGSAEVEAIAEGSAEPAPPTDGITQRVQHVLAALEAGELEEAQELLDGLDADGATRFQSVQNARNRFDAIKGLTGRIEGHLAAQECVAADTLVIELRDTYSRPAGMGYYGQLDACRDAARDAARDERRSRSSRGSGTPAEQPAAPPSEPAIAPSIEEPPPNSNSGGSSSGRSSSGRSGGPPSEL
ncbi:MAG: serine/threonine-protein kinase [Bradymonadia bacterium]|jgi:serine/threonine-protein kinase